MNSGFDMYQNSGYTNSRNRKRTLILDIVGSTELGAGSEFNIQLFEPLIIDNQSEIYLDNFVTFNSMLADKPERSSFCLKINEFNLNSNVASNDTTSKQSLFNSIVIPNENRNATNFFTSVSHKAKKFNYICDVNPMTISSLSGTVTSLDNKPMFHGDVTTSTKTYALTGIVTWDESVTTDQALTEGQEITSIAATTSGVTISSNIRILCNTERGATNIFFSTDEDVSTSAFSNQIITIIVPETTETSPRAAYTFTVGTVGSGIQLLKGDGRMTAELSIISRNK